AGKIPPPFTTYENLGGSIGGGGDGDWFYGNFTAGVPYLRLHTQTFNCQKPIVGQTLGLTTCGASDGVISLTVSDGVAPFSFQWEDGSTGNQISNVPAGAYKVEVTDAHNCLSEYVATISDANGP